MNANLYLFGSRARMENDNNSDVDIIITIGSDMGNLLRDILHYFPIIDAYLLAGGILYPFFKKDIGFWLTENIRKDMRKITKEQFVEIVKKAHEESMENYRYFNMDFTDFLINRAKEKMRRNIGLGLFVEAKKQDHLKNIYGFTIIDF